MGRAVRRSSRRRFADASRLRHVEGRWLAIRLTYWFRSVGRARGKGGPGGGHTAEGGRRRTPEGERRSRSRRQESLEKTGAECVPAERRRDITGEASLSTGGCRPCDLGLRGEKLGPGTAGARQVAQVVRGRRSLASGVRTRRFAAPRWLGRRRPSLRPRSVRMTPGNGTANRALAPAGEHRRPTGHGVRGDPVPQQPGVGHQRVQLDQDLAGDLRTEERPVVHVQSRRQELGRLEPALGPVGGSDHRGCRSRPVRSRPSPGRVGPRCRGTRHPRTTARRSTRTGSRRCSTVRCRPPSPSTRPRPIR